MDIRPDLYSPRSDGLAEDTPTRLAPEICIYQAGGSEGGQGNLAGAPGAGGIGSDQCGGCDLAGPAPEICIYQAGGPGPGRFTCATQNPCGAAGACVCIVGQGPCSNMLMGVGGGSAGYCVCDNGLD